jgi:AbrB family looped-hinge helix DNA binding protein
MAKVTSKLQVTIPKRIAEQYGIAPGDEVEFEPSGDVIRVVPRGRRRTLPNQEERLRRFDAATARQRWPCLGRLQGRDWKREDDIEPLRDRRNRASPGSA